MEKAITSAGFYQPEVSLSVGVIKRDLTKTLLVTILALALQFMMYTYLQRGGWPVVLKMLEQFSF